MSCAASIGGLVGSGIRLRLRVSSSSGPASFCGVLVSSPLVSRAEFEYCADIYRAQYTCVLSAMLGNSRADVLYVQDVSTEGAETIPECTLGICRRSIQTLRGKAGIGVYRAPTILP